jgi:hypothetical protein
MESDAKTDGVTRIGTLDIADSEMESLSDATIVKRLVESGVSRLSAERIVEVHRSDNEPGRARRHAQGHRLR